MRFALILISILALGLAGCCGGPSLPGMQAAPIQARTAAMAGDETHAGCHFDMGLACGDESIFGIQADLPDLRPILGLFAGGATPFAAPLADPLAEGCDPYSEAWIERK